MIEMLSKTTLFWISMYMAMMKIENLIVSYECYDLCNAIADEFQYDHKWLDILHNKQFKLEKV